MVKKVKEPISDRLWKKRVLELADAYLIIVTCKTCKSPVNKGYVCMFCDDINPTSED